MSARSREKTPEEILVESKEPEKVRAMFDAISPTYDRMNHVLSLGLDTRWRAFAARQLIRRDIEHVLDVCGGTGDMALALSRRAAQVGLRTEIVSTDFSPQMVHHAGEKTQRALRPFHVAIADTLRLPFRDSIFGLVTVAFGIRNVHDLEGAVREMARVCVPGGQLGILEFTMPRTIVLSQLYRFYFFSVLPRVGAMLAGSNAYRYLPKSVDKFPPPLEFAAMLRRVCGGEVRQYPLTFGTVCLHVARVEKRQGA